VGQDLDLWVARFDRPSCLDTAHDRHVQVPEHELGPQRVGPADGLRSLWTLGDHLEPILRLEELAERAPHQQMVVYHQNFHTPTIGRTEGVGSRPRR
jgi:hypothetical protein